MRQYIINVEICSWCPNCKQSPMRDDCPYCEGEKFTGSCGYSKDAHYHCMVTGCDAIGKKFKCVDPTKEPPDFCQLPKFKKIFIGDHKD
jgi:hypothetical protein